MGGITVGVKAVNGAGASSSLVRRLNTEALLRHAFEAEDFTAAEAMEATGLTRATVLGLCDELIGSGWLEELEDSRAAGLTRRGRPARRHRLRPDAGIVVGVDAGRRSFRAVASDLRGRTLASGQRVLEPSGVGRDERAEIARGLVQDTVAATATTAPTLITVVGVPAPVDESGVSPQGDGAFWDVMNAGFPEHLDGLVTVENDANLAARAEYAGGPCEHMATLLMGERFGAGLIVDGHLLRGAAGAAGEMRFLGGVLEDSTGADGVAALARRWTLDALDSGADSPVLAAIPADELSAVDVFSAARDGDLVARAVLERIADRIARIAAILVSLLGVEKVVVAGAISEAIGPVLERARALLPEIATAPFPEIVSSELGRDVVVRGAVEHALTRLREDPLGLLGIEG
ncbi:ROK family protein [Brachybacterium sp. GCM10030268]|uniref:ROK family protein n=1 Tax=Brachybacterium sp. GCM10030268 TaxID=3273382 RepID=UPI003610D44A